MTEWIGIITLIVAIATLIVAFATLIVSRRSLDVAKRSMKNAKDSERQRLLNEIASKEARLKAMEESTRYGMMDAGMMGTMMTHREMLKAEIEQLKQQLKNG
jgi:predicted Holliday junction resolvase-like endonuclease